MQDARILDPVLYQIQAFATILQALPNIPNFVILQIRDEIMKILNNAYKIKDRDIELHLTHLVSSLFDRLSPLDSEATSIYDNMSSLIGTRVGREESKSRIKSSMEQKIDTVNDEDDVKICNPKTTSQSILDTAFLGYQVRNLQHLKSAPSIHDSKKSNLCIVALLKRYTSLRHFDIFAYTSLLHSSAGSKLFESLLNSRLQLSFWNDHNSIEAMMNLFWEGVEDGYVPLESTFIILLTGFSSFDTNCDILQSESTVYNQKNACRDLEESIEVDAISPAFETYHLRLKKTIPSEKGLLSRKKNIAYLINLAKEFGISSKNLDLFLIGCQYDFKSTLRHEQQYLNLYGKHTALSLSVVVQQGY